MFRYYISLGTSTRVPRDLISGTLRMVSCITRLQPHPSPTGNGASRRAHFIQYLRFHFFPFEFLLWLSGMDGIKCENHVFIYFQKIKGNEV